MITFAFYLFAISVCTAGFMVVLSRNPVHSVLWLIALVLLALLTIAFGGWQISDQATTLRAAPILNEAQNTNALGSILYDRYLLPFQVAGLILLVAMIGAITLTMRHRRDVKRQNVLEQMYRDPATAMELRDVKPGQGL